MEQKNISLEEALTQHFFKLSEELKTCKDLEKSYQLIKLILEIYDRLKVSEII